MAYGHPPDVTRNRHWVTGLVPRTRNSARLGKRKDDSHTLSAYMSVCRSTHTLLCCGV
jgi:hypothetical protein